MPSIEPVHVLLTSAVGFGTIVLALIGIWITSVRNAKTEGERFGTLAQLVSSLSERSERDMRRIDDAIMAAKDERTRITVGLGELKEISIRHDERIERVMRDMITHRGTQHPGD